MRSFQLSYASGVISPQMQGRLDAREYANGLRSALNMLPTPQGALTRRWGLRHVNTASSNATASKLIPFVYSTDQALVVELADEIIRFHTQGASLLWAGTLLVGEQTSTSVSVSSGTITFQQPHGLQDNDALRFVSTDTLPGGLSSLFTYYAIVVDSHRIKVSASSGPGAAVTITAVNSGTMRAYTQATMPRDYVTQTAVSSWDQPGSRIVFAGDHSFETGDPVKLSDGGGATYPGDPALNSVDVYYAIDHDATSVKLAATKAAAIAGTSIDFSGGSAPSGTFNVDRHYVEGELFFWGGTGPGCYYVTTEHTAAPSAPNLSAVYLEPFDAVFEVPSPYPAADVFSVNYAQSNDVLTLVNKDHAPRELRRLGATLWDLLPINFGSAVAAPAGGAATENRGEQLQMRQAHVETINSTSVLRLEFETEHNLAKGDAIYVDSVSQLIGMVAGNYYILAEDAGPTGKGGIFRGLDGEYVQNTLTVAVTGVVFYASLSADNEQSYKLTSVDPNGIESTPSDAFTADNNLDVSGAENVLSWTAQTGAQKYFVYKEQNGLYGRIGESETTTFTDDNIAPDLALTPPIADDDLSGTDYPRAVAHHQQRRGFAGTVLKPRNMWWTKSGTESDLTSSLPVQSDDRISAAVAALKAQTIRHIVPLRRVLLLSSEGEWVVQAVDGELFAPGKLDVEQHSEIGCSEVRPIVVDNTVLFCANRGGHVFQFGFDFQTQSYEPVDQSLRAAHLFDGYEIVDSTFGRAPFPVAWWVSSSGQLLSFTTIPREEVRGWAPHETGGVFESCCVIPEGSQDSVYLSVQRTVNGATQRSIERIVPEVSASLEESVLLDASLTYDGRNQGATTMRVGGGNRWRSGESVTVTASATAFATGKNVGDEIEVRTGDTRVRILITGYTSPTVVAGKLLADLPTALQNTAVTSWAYCRRVISGLGHLEGEAVTIVRDGVIEATTKVVADGQVTADANGALVHVGHPYASEFETLPLVMGQVDGAGQGRRKNVQAAHLRVHETAGLEVGPPGARRERVTGIGDDELVSGEFEVTVRGKWGEGGPLVVRQDKPLPATVLGMTLEVELGG